MPSCQRCQDRGISCVYPQPKPSCFVLLEDTIPTLDSLSPEEATSLLIPAEDVYLNSNVDATSISLALDPAVPSHHLFGTYSPPVWFLAPETWKIDHRPVQGQGSFSGTTLKCYVSRIQQWLRTWVETGSNPFIHSRLYRDRFPSSVQVAYTTLSSYVNRTEANTEIILHIVEDRARELLTDNGVELDKLDLDRGSIVLEPVDTLTQLARVHALMVYQTISLYDGDIRSRHLAEGRSHILDRWATQLVERASCGLPLLLSPAFDSIDSMEIRPSDLPTPAHSIENLWRVWILAESVRRTWLMAKALHCLYMILQHGWGLCPGGIMFSTRQGVWEAPTSFAWEKLCSEVDVGLIQRFEAERLFTEASAADVDEFGKMMLETTFGTERVELWKA